MKFHKNLYESVYNKTTTLNKWASDKWFSSSAEQMKILFVVGTGRSGTHFLTRCLLGNPDVVDRMGGHEDPTVFV
jgi:hypothetical protein